MIDPDKRLFHRRDRGQAGLGRAFDQDHRDLQRSGCGDLAIGGAAAAVLGDDAIDPVFDEQGMLVGLIERSGRKDVADIGQGEGRLDGIDATNEIGVLRCGFEHRRFLPADRKQDTSWRRAQCCDGGMHMIDAGPEVARLALPARTSKGEGGDAGFKRGFRGIVGNTRGEGMRRVDQEIEAFGSQRVREAVGAAETADAGRDGLCHRRARAAGQRQHHIVPRARKRAGQRAGFRGATENKDMKAHA